MATSSLTQRLQSALKDIGSSLEDPKARAIEAVREKAGLGLSAKQRLAKVAKELHALHLKCVALSKGSIKNLVLTLDNGEQITIDSAGPDFTAGDAVTIDGKPAPDGEYRLHDGKTIIVVDGRIAELKGVTMKARAIAAVRKKAGISPLPFVGRTESEHRTYAIAANRRRVGL